MSVQLRINQLGGLYDNARNLLFFAVKGLKISITLAISMCNPSRTWNRKFKEIQNGNEMSHNTALSVLSHPAIEMGKY